MFQHLDVDDRVERVVAKGQFGNIAEHLDFCVIPGLVADAAIQADVAGMREKRSVGTFARACVQNMRTGRQFAGSGGEVFEKLGMKRIQPAHDKGGMKGWTSLRNFGLNTRALSTPSARGRK